MNPMHCSSYMYIYTADRVKQIFWSHMVGECVCKSRCRLMTKEHNSSCILTHMYTVHACVQCTY